MHLGYADDIQLLLKLKNDRQHGINTSSISYITVTECGKILIMLIVDKTVY